MSKAVVGRLYRSLLPQMKDGINRGTDRGRIAEGLADGFGHLSIRASCGVYSHDVAGLNEEAAKVAGKMVIGALS